MYRYLLLIIFLFAFVDTKAQIADTTKQRSKLDIKNAHRDSITSKPFKPKVKAETVYFPDSTHSPRRAVIKSLSFPGLGQIYNRHGLWWRLPLIYGGLGALAYNIYSNGVDYNAFLRESEWRAHGRIGGTDEEPLPFYMGNKITDVSDQTIYDYKDNLRRNRDLSIFGFILVWGVNAIDAYVDAKFTHSYSMDNNLGFKVTPSLMGAPGSNGLVYASNFNYTFTPTLKVTFFLK
jgi:hypothetical protein